MKTRRDFLKTTATVAVGSMIIPSFYSFKATKTPYGLILYTVRNEMKKNPVKTLNTVAATGYKVLEAAGYKDGLFYGMKPVQFKKLVDSLGMKLISSHTHITAKNAQKVADDAAAAGLKYVVNPMMKGGSIDNFKKGAHNYNRFGEIFKKNGVRFAYHNHAYEFKMIEGIIPYDILLQQTDPQLVAMEMDLYWITYGGHNPWEYFAKYPGRFELWHVKYMKDKVKREMTTVGNGIIDFKKIFSLAKQAGMKYYFVEQDTALENTPLENIKISLDYIKKMNF